MKKSEFIRLKTLDPQCRCCGRGKEHFCPKCQTMLKEGYAFFIELKDGSTAEHKRPTGHAIAIRASKISNEDETGKRVKWVPGVYFITKSELKGFMGDEYDTRPPRRVEGQFIATAPKWHKSTGSADTETSSTGGTRRAAELPTGKGS